MSTGTGSTTVDAARTGTQFWSRNAGTGSFSTTELDMCIQAAGKEILEYTNASLTDLSVSLTATNYTYDLSATTGFIDSRVTAARIGNRVLLIKEYAELMSKYDPIAPSQTTGEPLWVSWFNHDQMILYPIPDKAYTLLITYKAPLVSWTWGATDNTTKNTVLNVPDELAFDIMSSGAPHYLMRTDPQYYQYSQILEKTWNTKLEKWKGRTSLDKTVRMERSLLPWANGGYAGSNVPGMSW
jgi:hypothetical protein